MIQSICRMAFSSAVCRHRKMVLKSMVALFAVAVLIGGCNARTPDEPGSAVEPENGTTIRHELKVDGITLIAEGVTSRSKKLSKNHRSIQIGDHQIDLKDGELHVNGRTYGQFFDGDEVQIARDGVVLVNGQEIGSRPLPNGTIE